MTEYIDTHCHLDLKIFDEDREAVIQRAVQSGVGLFINPGINLSSSRKAIELAKQFTQIRAAVGVHPNDVDADWRSHLDEIAKIANDPCVRAIGEIGLDQYHKDVPIDLQMDAFTAQLELAIKINLPVIIHCRQALDLIFPILRSYSDSIRAAFPTEWIGVMHSFEGNADDAGKYIDLGFMIGIGGPVTYKNALVKHELVSALPLDAILLETDSPFLTPVPHRGSRNEPAYIPQIGKRTAIIRGCSEATIQSQTTSNARTLFRLGVNQ